MSASHVALLLLGGYPFKLLCNSIPCNLKTSEWIGISFISNFLNHVIPYQSGLGFRYLYMRQRFNLSLATYAQIVFIYATLHISIVLALLLFALFNIRFTIPLKLSEFQLGTLLALVLVSIGLFYKLFPIWHEKQSEKMRQWLSVLRTHINKPHLIILSFINLLGSRLAACVAFYWAFKALHYPISWEITLLIVCLMSLASLIFITPGNLGITESIAGLVTHYAFKNFPIGFSAMLIFRATQFVVTAMFSIFFSQGFIKKTLEKQITGKDKDIE